MSGATRERGAQVARALAGAWRTPPPPLEMDPREIEAITPLLLAGGVAALVSRRLRERAPLALRQAHRLQVLLAAAQEPHIEAAVGALRAHGLEPLLGKGWAAARAYPEPGLRPMGDIDLYLPRGQAASARALLEARDGGPQTEDVHDGFAELDAAGAEALHARSRLLPLGQGNVRVFGPEDHLRLVALHALRHGVVRPLWLCDVAAALEARPEPFDWDLALGGRPAAARNVAAALGLSARLLGADLGGAPPPARRGLPGWASEALLAEWGDPRPPHGARVPFAALLRRPRAVLPALRMRWPNAVEAAAALGGAFSGWPPSALRLAAFVLRAARFAPTAIRA